MSDSGIVLDFGRGGRIGLDEAVLCAGKSDAHLAAILDRVASRGASMLLTRLSPEALAALPAAHRARLDYDALSATGFYGEVAPATREGRVAIVEPQPAAAVVLIGAVAGEAVPRQDRPDVAGEVGHGGGRGRRERHHDSGRPEGGERGRTARKDPGSGHGASRASEAAGRAPNGTAAGGAFEYSPRAGPSRRRSCRVDGPPWRT